MSKYGLSSYSTTSYGSRTYSSINRHSLSYNNDKQHFTSPYTDLHSNSLLPRYKHPQRLGITEYSAASPTYHIPEYKSYRIERPLHQTYIEPGHSIAPYGHRYRSDDAYEPDRFSYRSTNLRKTYEIDQKNLTNTSTSKLPLVTTDEIQYDSLKTGSPLYSANNANKIVDYGDPRSKYSRENSLNLLKFDKKDPRFNYIDTNVEKPDEKFNEGTQQAPYVIENLEKNEHVVTPLSTNKVHDEVKKKPFISDNKERETERNNTVKSQEIKSRDSSHDPSKRFQRYRPENEKAKNIGDKKDTLVSRGQYTRDKQKYGHKSNLPVPIPQKREKSPLSQRQNNSESSKKTESLRKQNVFQKKPSVDSEDQKKDENLSSVVILKIKNPNPLLNKKRKGKWVCMNQIELENQNAAYLLSPSKNVPQKTEGSSNKGSPVQTRKFIRLVSHEKVMVAQYCTVPKKEKRNISTANIRMKRKTEDLSEDTCDTESIISRNTDTDIYDDDIESVDSWGEKIITPTKIKDQKIQQNLIEGMFKLAEKKYGRKRPQRGDKGNAMEDYELYLRSLKAKVKTSQDKLNGVLKQKKDIEAKVAQAERDFNTHQSKYDKAEEEKQNAINDGRDPELPKDFIVPQRAKKANAGLGALVMKASAGMWEEKFSAMRKAKSSSNTPEWMAKQKKSDKTSALLKVGKTATEKKGSRRRRKDEDDKPNAFTVNLKKTGLRKEEEEPARRPRRGRGGDSDED